MIYDVFMFNDEYEMLECRLQQSRGFVDRTIAIEGNQTMSGQPKPYYLTEAQAEGRFGEVSTITIDLADLNGIELPQLNYVTPDTVDHWRRDLKQRSGADQLIADLAKDDIVITGDVDEVPQYDRALDAFDGTQMAMVMEWLVYSVNWHVPGRAWIGTNISTAASISGQDAGTVRRSRITRPNQVRSGWHLSWFGTPEARFKKIHQFAHGEMVKDAEEVAYRRFGQRLTPDGNYMIVPFTGTLPEYISEGTGPQEWYA